MRRRRRSPSPGPAPSRSYWRRAFDGLDPPSREVLTDLLSEAAASGAAVVVSTHRLDIAERASRPSPSQTARSLRRPRRPGDDAQAPALRSPPQGGPAKARNRSTSSRHRPAGTDVSGAVTPGRSSESGHTARTRAMVPACDRGGPCDKGVAGRPRNSKSQFGIAASNRPSAIPGGAGRTGRKRFGQPETVGTPSRSSSPSRSPTAPFRPADRAATRNDPPLRDPARSPAGPAIVRCADGGEPTDRAGRLGRRRAGPARPIRQIELARPGRAWSRPVTSPG